MVEHERTPGGGVRQLVDGELGAFIDRSIVAKELGDPTAGDLAGASTNSVRAMRVAAAAQSSTSSSPAQRWPAT